MKMVQVALLKSASYGGKRYEPGQVISMPRKHAELYVAFGKAQLDPAADIPHEPSQEITREDVQAFAQSQEPRRRGRPRKVVA